MTTGELFPQEQGPVAYVDELFEARSRNAQAFRVGGRHGHKWCHLWCDPEDEKALEELHRIAGKIGLKRAWFQDREGFPHYDLVPTKRAAAIRAGAVETNLADWVRAKRLRQTMRADAGQTIHDYDPQGALMIAFPGLSK